MGSDFEPGDLAAGSVLVDRKRLHAEIDRELMDRKDAFIALVQ